RQSWFDISRGAPPPSSTSIRQEVRTSISVASMRRSYGDLSKLEETTNDHWSPNAFRQKNLTTHGSQLDLSETYQKPVLRRSISTPRLAGFDSLRPSFNMSREVDYNKKIHVRSVDASKVQKQFNQASENQTPKSCKLCDRQVFQMEQIKAEKAVWHKNCFRCKECGKQLNVDTYESHEGILYCKPHYKQLFQPKAHFDDDEPKCKFQSNGSLHHSESESEHENEDQSVLRSSKKRERPQSFAAMGDVKQKFSEGCFANESAQRREEFEKEKKEELIKLRARLCAVGEESEKGRQARLKEMYEDSVKDSETNIKRTVDTDLGISAQNARLLKEQFEKGNCESDIKHRTFGEEDLSMLEVATAKESRSLFKELDANAGKTEVTLRRSQSQMIPGEHRRSLFLQSQISNEVVRSSDVIEDVTVETHDIASRFKFFETFKQREQEEKKEHKRFKITPPRELQPIQEPQDQEVYRDPTVIRADDKIQDELPKDTTRKALSIFKQMEIEAAQQELASGPKPLKRFTPPPEYAGGDSENTPTNERAIAKNLRNKFERWEAEVEKENRLNHSQSHLSLYEEEGIEHSLESTRDIKARFEALNNQPTTPVIEQKSRTKVHRFVEIQPSITIDVCCACNRKVYAMERHEGSGRLYHKNCFKCSQCSCILRLDSFSFNAGKLYCIVHYTQNFKVKGNYEEGFGTEPTSKNWKTTKTEQLS
ncbi:hypothetical protein QYM36_007799, partial [Artemia franciscana]